MRTSTRGGSLLQSLPSFKTVHWTVLKFIPLQSALRRGTLSHTLPKALPLESAKEHSPLEPNVRAVVHSKRKQSPRILQTENQRKKRYIEQTSDTHRQNNSRRSAPTRAQRGQPPGHYPVAPHKRKMLQNVQGRLPHYRRDRHQRQDLRHQLRRPAL